MTKRERVDAALAGGPVDRTTISLWRHFPDIDLDPTALAEALLDFHRRYDLDFIKVMPNGVYCVQDWGCETAYQGGSIGARTCVRHAVQRIEDWGSLRPLDPSAGALGRELACLRAVRAQVRDAIAQCGGRRLIVGPGCVLDLRAPEANLAAARQAVEDLPRP